MYQICKVNYDKYIENNNDVNVALLQIRSTLITLGLPSLATILFKQPIRGMLLKINRPPLFYNYDEDHYDKPKLRQDKIAKNNDTLKDHTLISIGSTVALQREDGRPQMHGMVMDHSNSDHHGR